MPRPRQNAAFSRVELLVVIGASFLLASVALPALGSANGTSKRAVCANNLRLIGAAAQSKAATLKNQFTWWTSHVDFGTRIDDSPKFANAWWEFLQMSNELVTPKILACPADDSVRRARVFWGAATDAALVDSGYRANSVSYVLGLHATTDAPLSWLSGDRNIMTDGASSNCVASVRNADVALTSGETALGWTNGASHGEAGHALLTDGSVEFTSTPRLRQLVRDGAPEIDGPAFHFLRAR